MRRRLRLRRFAAPLAGYAIRASLCATSSRPTTVAVATRAIQPCALAPTTRPYALCRSVRTLARSRADATQPRTRPTWRAVAIARRATHPTPSRTGPLLTSRSEVRAVRSVGRGMAEHEAESRRSERQMALIANAGRGLAPRSVCRSPVAISLMAQDGQQRRRRSGYRVPRACILPWLPQAGAFVRACASGVLRVW